MSNAMSQRASEEPGDQVQGENLTKQTSNMASNKASTAVDATTSNGTSGNTDISEEEADAWYRNCPSREGEYGLRWVSLAANSHNVPPNSFASSSSRSSSSFTSSVATTPGFTNFKSISNNSAETRETSPPSLATSGDGSPVKNHHHQQPQHHPQQHNHHRPQHNHHPHPNHFLTPNLDHNLNHPQCHQHPLPAQDPLFHHLITTWLRHLHHILQAHAVVVRRMLREAVWRLWVLMNEDTPRLVRTVRGHDEEMHFNQENLGTHYVLFTQSKSNLLSLITFTITIANKITTMNQHNMCFLMAQLQPSTTIPIPPALPSMDQSDNECFSHHACPTEPPPKPSEADRNVTIASKDETRQTAVSPTIHPDASVNIPGPATPSTARPACYDTYSVLLTVVWLRYLPDYLPPRKRRHRCRVHCRRHQHARHCFGGVDQTAEEGMDLDDVTEKDGDMRWRRYYPDADKTAHSHG
ncbi:hypothetical protein GE21DRAFT_1309594 [Neurospora crassa]|nr:hypothetical protein GE21DRAFT_1309594 [Neurospora crassa]